MKVTATVDRLRRSGVEVIDFGAGEPDFPTPDADQAAAHAAIDENFTQVHAGRRHRRSEARDLRSLSGRLRRRVHRVRSHRHRRRQAGAYNTALALFGPGDEVITHAPYWPTLTEQIKLADATPVFVRTHAEDGFAIRAQAMLDAVTPRTRGIIINSPCNPTGALIAEEELRHARRGAARSRASGSSSISATRS